MMLGMAASSSMATPMGRLSQRGASSVITSAMPKLTGTPTSNAITDVTTVPYRGASAPNWLVTGFHSLLPRNLKPKVRSAGQAPVTSTNSIPITDASTSAAKSWVSPRKARSPSELSPVPFGTAPPSEPGGGGTVEVGPSPSSRKIAASCAACCEAATSFLLRSLVLGRPDLGSGGGVLQVLLPALLDQLNDRGGHRHEAQLLGGGVPLAITPVEELEHGPRHLRVLLLALEQHERGSADGPGRGAGLIREDHVEAPRLAPIRTLGGGLHPLVSRVREGASLILQLDVGHLVLDRVGGLHVADGPVDALDVRGDPLVALAADPDRPCHGLVGAHGLLPVRADLREVVGEDPGGPRAIRAVHDGDGHVRQLQALVQLDDLRVVPLLELAHQDLGQHIGRHLQLARLDARQVDDGHHGPHYHRELHQVRLVQLLGLERRIRRAEVDGAFGDLFDAAARADRLVVELDLGVLGVSVRPLRVQRIREGGAGA